MTASGTSASAGEPAPARTGVSPVTKAARHAQIEAILVSAAAPVRSQEDLAERLARRGVRVTQATLSRDLEELGAVRLRGRDGALVYALPGPPGGPGGLIAGRPVAAPANGGLGSAGTDGTGRLAASAAAGSAPGAAGDSALRRVAAELLLAAEASANLVVVRTRAGAAQFLASVIDHAGWPSVLGTVAGDDTVLVIARDPVGGSDLAESLLRLAEGRN